ncbi:MAG: FAD-dependent oxidoreductase [Myxococcales bacterium]|nr:FAD-dependent oxidoreductase [Myxococcales bacterium]
MTNLAIIGGGVIGRSIAYRLAAAKIGTIRVFEQSNEQRGASFAAAGMVAAQAEAILHDDDTNLQFNVRARTHLRNFTDELTQLTHRPIPWWNHGILVVAADDIRTRGLGDCAVRQRSLGLRADVIDPLRLMTLEPMLQRNLAGGVLLPDDSALHTGLYMSALEAALGRVGVVIEKNVSVHGIELIDDRFRGLRTSTGRMGFDAAIVCNGAWLSDFLSNIPLRTRIRPTRGQIVEVGGKQDCPRHIVFAPGCYLVPRQDNTLLIGATMEDVGFDESVTLGGVSGLGTAAAKTLQGVQERPLLAVRSGLRPMSDDGQPMIGQVWGIPGLFVAAGHGRDGILTSAITADIMRSIIADNEVPHWATHLSPSPRFA